MANGMSGRLAGKVALIIGAARGIGAGIAERFHEEGAQVVIADTEAEAGAATAERLKGKFVATDISKPADAERAVEATLAAYGDLHIVVQNAGIYPWSLIENISPEEWDMVLGVNLRGVFLIARAALPHMKAKRYGRMVFTSSITGPRVTSPGHGHYSASKAGINGFINRRRWNSPATTSRSMAWSRAISSPRASRNNAAQPSSRAWWTPFRSAAWARRATLRTLRSSSLRTKRPTSPEQQSSLMAVRFCPRARIFGWGQRDLAEFARSP